MGDISASGRHEAALIERVEDATARPLAAEAEEARAREVRDMTVRAAVKAGLPATRVAEIAGISGGMVSRIVNAPR